MECCVLTLSIGLSRTRPLELAEADIEARPTQLRLRGTNQPNLSPAVPRPDLCNNFHLNSRQSPASIIQSNGQ